MEKKEHTPEDRIAEKLRGHAVAPPPHVWGNIQAQMATGSERQRPFWLLDASALLLWLLLSVAAQSGTEGTDRLEDHGIANTQMNTQEEANRTSSAPQRSTTKAVPTRSEHLSSGNLTSGEASVSEDAGATGQSANTATTLSSSKGSSSRIERKLSRSERTSQTQGQSPLPVAASLSSTTAKATFDGGTVPLAEVEEAAHILSPAIAKQEMEAPSFMLMTGRGVRSLATPSDDALPMQLAELNAKDKNPFAKKLRKHQFFLGISGMLNLASIFNQNTRHAFDKRELPYKPTLGYAGAIRLGYRYWDPLESTCRHASLSIL